MFRRILTGLPIAAILLAFPCAVLAAELPVEDGREVVAHVNDEAIVLEDLLTVLMGVHSDKTEADGPQADRTADGLLKRLIDARLVAQEARNIGLDETEEMIARRELTRIGILRDMLIVRQLERPDEIDAEEFDRRYAERVQEVRVRSLLFQDEGAALNLRAAVDGGRPFDELANAAIETGEATEGVSEGFGPVAMLYPVVREALAAVQPGGVTPVIALPGGEGWAVLKLIEVRVPEVSTERESLAAEMQTEIERNVLKGYSLELQAKYAKVDTELLRGLEYEEEGADLSSFLADDRIVAEVEGAEPVMVAELSTALFNRYYHGPKWAAEKQLLSKDKYKVLSNILDRRVIIVEGERLGLHETDEYLARLSAAETAMLFDEFLKRVIEPGVEVREEDIVAYYEEHAAEYTFPGMVRLDSVLFETRTDAESAVATLERGAELAWVRQNATGQATLEADDTAFSPFRGSLIVRMLLPEDVRIAIDGAEAGEIRLIEEQDGERAQVLVVREVVPERVQALDEVRAEIEREVKIEARGKAVEDYLAKLREVSEIKIYATGDELMDAVMGN